MAVYRIIHLNFILQAIVLPPRTPLHQFLSTLKALAIAIDVRTFYVAEAP